VCVIQCDKTDCQSFIQVIQGRLIQALYVYKAHNNIVTVTDTA